MYSCQIQNSNVKRW